MLGLVDGAAHPRELSLEGADAVVEKPAFVLGGSPSLAQLLLDLGPQRALCVDVLLGQAHPALAFGDHRDQPVRLRARLGELLLDLADPGDELVHGRLGLGGAPPGALGGELGASQLPGVEQLGAGTAGATAPRGVHRDLPDGQRHHHRAHLEERLSRQLRRELGRHREGIRHVPGAAPISEGGSGIATNR